LKDGRKGRGFKERKGVGTKRNERKKGRMGRWKGGEGRRV
jgi:hypothetical protein